MQAIDKVTLTPRQQQIYDFIKDKIVNRGYGPTVREIGAHCGIKSPNGVMCHLKALVKKGVITREAHRSRAIQLTEQPQRRMSMPLAGQIAAGSPLEAIEQAERIDFGPLFDDGRHFCVQVTDDSMAGDQIANGDWVVVRQQGTCRDGKIAAVTVDDGETLVKRYFKQAKRAKLESVNTKAKPIYSKNVKVLGVVVGVIRQY